MGHTSNFHIPINIEPDSLRKALNSVLPVDIRIVQCQRAEINFNARFNALGKTYIFNGTIFARKYGAISDPACDYLCLRL